MIDTHARIQINRDSLQKIVKLTAESKIDKIRIKALKEELHTEKNNTYAEKLKVTIANTRTKELEDRNNELFSIITRLKALDKKGQP